MTTKKEGNKKKTAEYWGKISAGLFGNASKIQLIANRELSVEGCLGVLEYTETTIRFNLGNCQLKVMGRGLSIPVMERNLVQVEGYITAVEFV